MMDEQQEKKIINALRSLKREKAPADFLSSVHARIEKRSHLAEIINAIFQPLQIKIPLQLAGAALTIMLIVLVTQSNQPPIPSAVVPPATKMAKTVVRPMAVASTQKATTAKTLAIALVFKEGEIERETSDGDKYAQGSLQSATPQNSGIANEPLAMAKVEEENKKIAETKGYQDLAGSISSSKCKIDQDRLDQTSKESKNKADKNLNKLIQIVEEAKGEVVLIERQKESDKPKALVAKISAVHIGSFLSQIRLLGKVTVPSIPKFSGKFVIVRIDISY
ncbi:MAG: hypothetical protein WC890_05980 [Candidatus Margulisiibacteriota bacterium]